MNTINEATERSSRNKRDTVNPCRICGWSAHMAVHLPVVDGTRIGQPFDHAYKRPARHYRRTAK